MKIKFCGLFRECDIAYANALMPDFVGFVFAENSRRFVDFGVAKKLKSRLDSSIKAVGVFVDNPIDSIVSAVRDGIIEMVQLHGNENNAYISELRESLQRYCGKVAPIIKAVKVRDSQSLGESLAINADFILLDSANAGSGKAFEWGILEQSLESQDFKRDFSTRFFLAGGINADNLAKAITLNPYAIDISSGIESQGKKDFKKMQKIIRIMRRESK